MLFQALSWSVFSNFYEFYVFMMKNFVFGMIFHWKTLKKCFFLCFLFFIRFRLIYVFSIENTKILFIIKSINFG